MLECLELDGAPQGLLHAIACAVFQFSATPQTECRDMLSAELLGWLSTAREPNLGDRDLPRSVW
jgi:hypothetical protein